MKFLLSFSVCLFFLFSCKNEKDKTATPEVTTDTVQKENKSTTNTSTIQNTDKGDSTAPPVRTDAGTQPVNENNTTDAPVSTGWTATDEADFINECKPGAIKKIGDARANDYCNCILEKMKATYASYIEANKALIGDSKGTFAQMTKACEAR